MQLQAPISWLKTEISEWKPWWSALSIRARATPVSLVLAWWAALAVLDGLGADQLRLGSACLALAYGGRKARLLLKFLLPLILTGVVYDSLRFYSDFLRGEVRVKEPFLFDLRFFGIDTPMGKLTPNLWWQFHLHPALDLLAGLAYLVFVPVFVIHAGFLRFRIPGAAQEGALLMWAFFWVNVLGYSTYFWYPAAPPWYVADHGFGPAILSTPASAAGCVRFDELLGTQFFTGWYGRSNDVFGAIPSLHVAYPLLSVISAYRIGHTRAFTIGFYAIMCFAAVYLNHHYVLDLVWGSVYAILIGAGMRWWSLKISTARQ